MKKLLLIILIVAFVSLATAMQSSALTISATERGTYISSGIFGSGGSGDADGNYLTGVYHIGGEYRSFFNFDLSSISGPITSATLIISLDNTFGSSPPKIETLGIFDYTGSISDLIGNTGGVAAFTDLGTGTLYGSGSASTDATMGTMSIAFNAGGLSDMNAAIGGYFAVGGALTSLSGSIDEFLFGSSLGAPLTLFELEVSTVPVPEPTTMLLLGSGLICLAGFRRKFRKR